MSNRAVIGAAFARALRGAGPYPAPVPRPRLVVPSVLVACVLASACSSSVSDIRPSPVPPGYLEALARDGGEAGTTRRAREDGEQIVDGIVAAVGDKVLTRSEVLRSLRIQDQPRRPGATEEDEIEAERVRWASTQLVVLAAYQAGLRLEARMLDSVVEDVMEGLLEEASEKEGRPVSEEEWLASKRLTKEEFRRRHEGQVVSELYVQKLMRGVGGPTRPEVDWDVTPAEVRRIFRAHPEAFDEPAKVRSAVFQIYVSGLADEEHTPAEWQDLAERRAEQLAELFRQGHDHEFLAKRYGLDQENMGLSLFAPSAQPLDVVQRQMGGQGGIPGIQAWLERPDLGARQTLVASHPQGPFVYGVIEFEPAARKSFEEAYDDIVSAIRAARQASTRARVVIQMLATGSAVSPPELEDRVLDAAQQTLDEIAANEILGKVRLR